MPSFLYQEIPQMTSFSSSAARDNFLSFRHITITPRRGSFCRKE